MSARTTNDPDSSRSPLIECYDGDDDGDGWDAMEEIFTQHDQSLSQDIGDDIDSEEEDNECESGDSKPEALRLFGDNNEDERKPSALKRVSTDNNTTENEEDDTKPSAKAEDEFMDYSYAVGDEEFANLDIEALIDSTSGNSNSNWSGNADISSTSVNNGDDKVGHTAESNQKKEKRPTLFESATTAANKKQRKSTGTYASSTQTNKITQHFSTTAKKGKKSRKSSASVQSNTLTQCFASVTKEEKFNASPNERTGSRKLDGLVSLRGENTTFKKGDIWIPKEKSLKAAGFAVTLGDISMENMRYVAEISAAWMRIERTFLGPEEGAAVKESIGIEWVLVKQHELLPANGIIQLQKLSKRITENLPNEATALIYERDGNVDHSFYYQCGKPLSSLNQNNTRPNAVDLFAGAGGASVGLDRAGFDVKWKVEMNKPAADTLKMNFGDKYIFCEDIAKWIQSCKSMRVHIYPRGDEMIVYIHGSPPCQGFSAVNTSGGANDAQNNECTLTFLEAIEDLQPTFVSMENVPGMGQEKNSE